MSKLLEFDEEIKLASALASSPCEHSLVRLNYMLLGYVRILESQVTLLARSELQRPMWIKEQEQ